MTIRPSSIGEAEKFNVRVPRHVVTDAVSFVTFVNRGTAGGTEYELVRLQNYRSVLKNGDAYLISSERRSGTTVARQSHRDGVTVLLVVAAVLEILLLGTAGLIRRLTGRRWAEAAGPARFACLPLGAVVTLPLLSW